MLLVATAMVPVAFFLSNLVGIYMTLLYLFTILGAATLPLLLRRGNAVTTNIGLLLGGAYLTFLYSFDLLENSWATLGLITPVFLSFLYKAKGEEASD